MIYPIVAYGDPVLKKKANTIDKDYPKFETLLENMFETMYNASGVGLAAPQIGLPIRLFIIDTTPFADDEDLAEEEQNALRGTKMVFINAEILEETGEEWSFTEGCLSIPNVREDVVRKDTVTIKYLDANFKEHTQTFNGLLARVIQHEYDHIEGILFTDRLSSLKKRLIKGKLTNISRGKSGADYRMRYPAAKKAR